MRPGPTCSFTPGSSRVRDRFLLFLCSALLLLANQANAQGTGSTISIWDDSVVPGTVTDPDPASVELGTKFTVSADGFVTGVRFYKGSENTGTHEGRLWTLDGTLLAEVTFTNETASGWQEALFAEPVPVTTGTVYVVSYLAPNGRYSADTGFFAGSGVTNGPLRALQDGENGGNGVYLYGNGGFPNQTYQASNYWVDVVFTDDIGPDTTPPTVTAQAPAPGAVDVATDSVVTAAFSEALEVASISESTFELRDSGGVVIPATVAWDEGSLTATLTPAALLIEGETYTALVRGGETEPTVRDLAGNALASDVSWSFTTPAPDVTPPTVTAVVPSDGAVDVPTSATIQAVFSEALDPATVSDGTFVLTDEGGAAVAATVTWDLGSLTATLDPVDPLTTGTTFTATLAGAPGDPAITDLAGNPLSNDVTWLFRTVDAADTTPPVVTAIAPADGAADVAVDTTVTATFDEDLDPASVTGETFVLLVGGNPVSGTVTYESASRVATFEPVAALPPDTQITARLQGGTSAPRITDSVGNALASDVSWTFTTGALPAACLANRITAENCLPGSPPSEWDINGVGDPTIQGFATDISVNVGETVQFKVDTDAAAYRFDIYRLGYYEGLGARKVDSVLPTANLPQNQPACLQDFQTGLVDCGNWAVSGSWDVPADAVSGVYLARLVRADNGGASHVVFIVRDDASTADLLFQTSDTTWQAYNEYGGNSLYVGSPAGRAYKVSYNRPFTTRIVSGGQDWLFNAEYPMIRWLEANGYDVTYFTNVDTDRRGDQLLNHRVFLSVGHDEYWSAAQRANVEAARDAGVHLAFFSGNEIFWKTRWEAGIDAAGEPYRTLVCYKETSADAKIDPEPVWTGTWRDPRFSPPADGGRPENELTGQLFRVNDGPGGTASMVVPAEDGRLRFWRNTDIATLAPGTSATLPFGVLGYEWDVDVDNGFRPPGSIRMSSTTVNAGSVLQDFGDAYAPETVTHSLTLYRAPSGALVFGSGTVQWSWGLDDQHDRAGTPTDPRMQQATVNLLADMNVQPATLQSGLVPATASTDTVPPTAVIDFPADGVDIPAFTALTVSGTAADAGGGVVGGVEVSTDGGNTWWRAEGRENWSYTFTPNVTGSLNIRVRAADDSANLEVPGAGVTVTVGAGGSDPCPCTVWDDSVIPPLASSGDSGSLELGVKFRALTDGFVAGIRFYKGSLNTGTHIGNLWAEDGTLLATATFVNESASGWQTVLFDQPVAVTTGSVYVASYFAPDGGYALAQNFFAGGGVSNGLVELLADGDAGGNGVYVYGPTSSFPTQTWNSSNYWVDVVFQLDTTPDETPPVVVGQSPAPDALDVPFATTVTATFDEDLDGTTVDATTFELRDGGGNLLPGVVSYDGGTRTAAFDPDNVLQPTSVYTATLIGGSGGIADLAGNALPGDVSWSFTTDSIDTTPPTVTDRDPAPDATSVGLGTTVSATFDEPLDPASVSSTTFELRDAGGNLQTGAVSYDDATRTAVLSPSPQLLPSTLYTATLAGGAGSAITDTLGNALAADVSWSFTTQDPAGCPCSLWDDSIVPGTTSDPDTASVELGMKFTSSVDGFVTGVRFYKGSQNVGTHVGRLWTLDGALLAEVTFTNESASGWQQALFAEPVPVTAGTVYVVSYLAPNGGYSADNGYFAGTGVTTGPLRALQNGENGGNGVYLYGSGGFPNQTYQSSNYWVDVVFEE